ncbi:MAG: MBL fold metallo-hydrolase [Pseudomonadota bacterium]
MADGYRFRIWGCRGSLPLPGVETARYGGDTACYELECPDGYRLIIDAGSGLRSLGAALMKQPSEEVIAGDLLLTHLHLDHIMGLASFKPFLARKHSIAIWSARSTEEVDGAIRRVFRPPVWPIDILEKGETAVHRLDPSGQAFGPVRVRAFPLNHPDGAHGFRIEAGETSICIVSDHEHGDGTVDARLVEEVRGADLMLYDAAYTVENYHRFCGWGHSTWEAGAELARAAGVRRTLLVHHAYDAPDGLLDQTAEKLAALEVRVEMAHDRMEIPL